MTKKKKRPLANPARGFATTSVASKPKPEKESTDRIEAEAEKDDAEIDETPAKRGFKLQAATHTSVTKVSSTSVKQQQHLTPQELEEQLERDDLQLFVEKHAAKIARDAARQILKVQTDCRVLRAQSQYLAADQWLPDELLQEILDFSRRELQEADHTDNAPSSKTFSEETTVARLWSLQLTLLNLGVPKTRIFELFTALLSRDPKPDSGSFVWGFRESLDLLSLDERNSFLPAYDGQRGASEFETQNTIIEVSELSFPSSEATTISQLSSLSHTPNLSGTATPNKVVRDEKDLDEDFDVSDVDTDIEPDELVSTYVETKARLFRLRPELVQGNNPKKKTFKGPPARPEYSPSPGIRKLQQKLHRIESDYLFDSDSAGQKWATERAQIRREEPQTRGRGRTRNQEETENHATSSTPEPKLPPAPALSEDSGSDSSDEELLLGDMFSVPNEGTGPVKSSGNDATDNPAVFLRDFGKYSGLNPRRVLEDACRARDPNFKISFRVVSPTAYASRHSVTILWSKGQVPVLEVAPPAVSFVQQTVANLGSQILSVTVTMTEVATPDSKQSEAYVATAALFCLFSSSPKEDKLYLRLPAAWRDLWTEFVEFRRTQTDEADRATVKAIRNVVQKYKEDEEEDGFVFSATLRGIASRDRSHSRNGSRDIASIPSNHKLPLNPAIRQLWEQKTGSQNYRNMLQSRMGLPIFGFKERALQTIEKSQVTILCGETGCGKSTQLPAYILEQELLHGRECKIMCTEPRRISAISLAQRVSQELGEYPNEVGTRTSLLGYAVRLESKVGPQARLIYATVGVVLRMLESFKGLDDFTHLIIDEVHERSIDTDFLLVILLSLMLRRPELKVVLMSATVDASKFSKYLNDAPIINVPGRTFPVATKFLEDAIELTHYAGGKHDNTQQNEDEADNEGPEEASGISQDLQGYSIKTQNTLAEYDEYRIDYHLIMKLMENIVTKPEYTDYSRAILVFLPGIAEIRELNDMLVGHPVFRVNCYIYPLHSTVSSEEQQEAFLIPPSGVRKIVLATNIAETGITIPDVTCVIDTGKHKEMRYDERRQLSRLIQSFISRANAKQRRGRAGRVQEGLCFHLFTKKRHDELMAAQQTPEMLRLSLQDLVMRVKICGLGDVEQTLLQAMDPPSSRNIRRAIDSLIEVGAFTSNEELTPLGRQLAKLPLDANLGKLCIISAIFGCLDAGLTIAAILSSKSPFLTPFGARQQADTTRLAFSRGESDLLTAYNAYSAWRRVTESGNVNVFSFCRKNFLSPQILGNIEDLKGQLLDSIYTTGIIKSGATRPIRNRGGRQRGFVQVPGDSDENSHNDIITSTVIAWSFYPKLLVRDGKGWRNVASSRTVSLHPTSVNKGNQKLKFLSYHSIMQATSKFYNAMSTTSVQELPLILLAGDVDFKLHAGVITIDSNRLRFAVKDWRTAIALKKLRTKLEEVVDWAVQNPGSEMSPELAWWKNIFERVCTKVPDKEN